MTEEEIDKYIAETEPFLVKNFDTEEDLQWAKDYIRRTLRKKEWPNVLSTIATGNVPIEKGETSTTGNSTG